MRSVPAAGDQFRKRVPYAEIPVALVQATIAAEDRRFWRHHGVDVRATSRAAWQLIRHRRVISGGSTITQQLIKLAEPRPRTFRTKLIEAVQALRLEREWSKQRILSEYLNRLEYGNGNVGCGLAAEFYFAKPLRDLSPAECALLAGLPQAPTRLNPHRNLEAARRRQRWILARMHQANRLTSSEFTRALEEPLRLARPFRAFKAPHFVDLVMSGLEAGHRDLRPEKEVEKRVEKGFDKGLDNGTKVARHLTATTSNFELRTSTLPHPSAPGPRISTTLSLPLTRFTASVLRRQLAVLRPNHVSNGAVVVLDNQSGDVLALCGSADYFAPKDGQVNGAWAPRSAGSTFKPFTYLLAFEHGATPASVVADVPTQFPTSTGLFAPVNYDRRCYGPMRYRLALANSLNISAVKVLDSIGGPEPLLDLLRSCGLTTLQRPAEEYGLGLTIGNAEARLLELANAYASLARLGQYKPFRLTRNEPERPLRPIAHPAAAWLIADILSDNDARALAFGTESPLRFAFPVACKTGTSSDFRDNWAFGFTPEFTVGVWVGNFDGSPMQEVSGVTGAGPILHEIFERLHEQSGTSWYPRLLEVVDFQVNPVTGKRIPSSGAGWPPQSGAGNEIIEKFVGTVLPPFQTASDFDAAGRVRLPAEYAGWFSSGDNWLTGRAVLAVHGSTGAERTAPRISFPLPGTVFLLDPDLPDQGRRILLRAGAGSAVQWSSQTLSLSTERGTEIAWLQSGRHRIVASDPITGSQAETWIEVRER